MKDTVKHVVSDLPREHWNKITRDRWLLNTSLNNMYCEETLRLRSHDTSYCLIKVVTTTGVSVCPIWLADY